MKRPRPNSSRKRTTEAAGSATVETRVFKSGNSDAVRLPKRFGLAGRKVRLRQLAVGRVLLEVARKRPWPAGFIESFGHGTTEDFRITRMPPHTPAEEARAARRFRDDG